MALIPSTLQSALSPLEAPVPSGSITALTIMNAFQAYALGCTNIMGFPISPGMPAFPAALAQLQTAMSAPVPASSIFVANLTLAISTAWGSMMTLFQVAPIVHVPPTLQSALEPICAVPAPSASVWIAGFTTAVHSYCMSSTITGVIPGTPPVPFTGPPL